ncbi:MULTISPECIES: hypothetical protein [unclassified Oceanispirochaeta]|nr:MULTISPECIES: hypothetical protein [unclassified Oceanispirochaeta]
MTIKVIIKGKEIKMTRKEFLRLYGNRKYTRYNTKIKNIQCQN